MVPLSGNCGQPSDPAALSVNRSSTHLVMRSWVLKGIRSVVASWAVQSYSERSCGIGLIHPARSVREARETAIGLSQKLSVLVVVDRVGQSPAADPGVDPRIDGFEAGHPVVRSFCLRESRGN